MMRGNASDSSSLEQSADGQSHSEGGINEDDDETVKQSPSKMPLQSDVPYSILWHTLFSFYLYIEFTLMVESCHNLGRSGYKFSNYRPENTSLEKGVPTLYPRPDGSLSQPPQLELVGHSIACASNPYDPYYGGMVAAYGQPMPYLHESRHQHAMRRARGSGGRFAKKSDADTSKGTGSGSDVSSQSINSSGSEPLLSKSSGAKAPEPHNLYDSAVSNFRKQTNLQETVYQSHSGEMGEGPASSQQWGNISSNHALAMQ
ncbi:UNVERIFIED_CONTAM: Nuclear transcription factor Y subunit A-1 [Sesamum angustifolium]|uniref:Nuclear transcription factor Y subunit n=1 Tax=Sesamum angustifolium TaxID=2727405 RepID=A0AAW2QRQ9_9LAMI